MSAEIDTERYIYPQNPHTTTNEELNHGSTWQSAPDFAPIITFALEATHPIAGERWARVCEQIVDKLQRLTIEWVAIECFHRTQRVTRQDNSDNVTILITVKSLPQMTDDLQRFLHEVHELSDYLLVEMAQGRISSGGDDEPNEVHVPAPYPVKPLVGSSIGTSHHAGRTGTLGGYVELVKEGSIKSCALTCASVAAPPNETSQVESGEGVVFSPSTTDHEASIARFKSDVAHLKDYRDTVEKESARSETPDRFASKLEFANNEIDRFEKKISETVDADREIGSIFSESESKILSEYASKGSRRIDWGLIELKAERVGTNTVRDANTWFRGGTQILGVTFPLPYQHVFKVGRSSETTRGIINGVQSCLSYGQNGREKHMEWAVVGQNDIGRPFSYCGDSGALILEQFFPRTLGLLWGGMDNGEQWGRGHDRSYFTPIGAVAEHILQTTGYHVQIQGGSDICCDPVLTKFAK